MGNTFKYRKTRRLKSHDYSKQGYCHVTICTYNHLEIFGEIENNKMILNQFGEIAKNAWLDLPNHHKNIKLDEFIIMPNHIHGIINAVAGAGPARPSNKNTKNNNLSIIIGSYKSSVTKQINRLNNNSFKWQRSFHDEIIRTSNPSLYNTRKYIINNPTNWDIDKNNIKNYSVKGEAGLAPATTF
ncbi:MAG: transposase [Candidatus Omnitrophota bacterium]